MLQVTTALLHLGVHLPVGMEHLLLQYLIKSYTQMLPFHGYYNYTGVHLLKTVKESLLLLVFTTYCTLGGCIVSRYDVLVYTQKFEESGLSTCQSMVNKNALIAGTISHIADVSYYNNYNHTIYLYVPFL